MRSEHKTRAVEWDAFTRWRHYLCYLQRSGVRKSIKQDSHRIDRRNKRQQLRPLFPVSYKADHAEYLP